MDAQQIWSVTTMIPVPMETGWQQKPTQKTQLKTTERVFCFAFGVFKSKVIHEKKNFL
jgi:hypothetical protein